MGSNWWIVALVVGVVGVGGFYWYRGKQRAQQEWDLVVREANKPGTTLGKEIMDAIVGGGGIPGVPESRPQAQRALAMARAGRRRLPKLNKARSI